jgi:hypothetical protein
MPNEPVRQDNGHLQESYLVEGRSGGGYSGAPVFMYIPPFAVRPGRANVNGKQHGPWFLGINWGHLVSWQPVCDSIGRPLRQDMKVAQNTGLMTVVPAWKLIELIDHPTALYERRAREDRLLGEGPSTAVSDGVPRSSC